MLHTALSASTGRAWLPLTGRVLDVVPHPFAEPMETMERELIVGISLERTSESIGTRWRERLPSAPESDDQARSLVNDLLRALTEERHCLRLLRSALGYGQACFWDGRPCSTLVHRMDVLEDVLLELPLGQPQGPDADVRGSHIHHTRAVLRLARMAALAGFTRAACVDRVRAARMLRHDIRNPLGTVRNAVEMVAERTGNGDHRLEELATRNLRAMESLIRERVSDTCGLGPEHGVATTRVGTLCAQAESLVRSVLGAWPFGTPSITGSWGERMHEPSAVLLTTALMLSLCFVATEPMELLIASSADAGMLSLEFRTLPPLAPHQRGEELWRIMNELAECVGAHIDAPAADSDAIRLRLAALGPEVTRDLAGADERAHF